MHRTTGVCNQVWMLESALGWQGSQGNGEPEEGGEKPQHQETQCRMDQAGVLQEIKAGEGGTAGLRSWNERMGENHKSVTFIGQTAKLSDNKSPICLPQKNYKCLSQTPSQLFLERKSQNSPKNLFSKVLWSLLFRKMMHVHFRCFERCKLKKKNSTHSSTPSEINTIKILVFTIQRFCVHVFYFNKNGIMLRKTVSFKNALFSSVRRTMTGTSLRSHSISKRNSVDDRKSLLGLFFLFESSTSPFLLLECAISLHHAARARLGIAWLLFPLQNSIASPVWLYQ